MKLLYQATNERRSVTIAGDVAQRVIFDNAFRGWEALLGDIGVPAVKVRPLRLAYRSTAPVMRFARARARAAGRRPKRPTARRAPAPR